MEAPPLHVLLVESSAVARTAIRFQLEQLGHFVETTGNKTELLALANRGTFDVALVDAQFIGDPVSQSFVSLEEQLPVLGIFSELDPADIRARLSAVLVKPFTGQQLAGALSAVRNQPPLVQKEDLLPRLGGKREVLAQMNALLQEQASAWNTEMGAALARRDGEALRRLAHQAKGALANLAAPRAAAAAQQLEDIARHGRWERAEESLSKFEAVADQVIRELAAM
jgi:HPt (histidine-containing phosphotransfer) domain-containing protein